MAGLEGARGDLARHRGLARRERSDATRERNHRWHHRQDRHREPTDRPAQARAAASRSSPAAPAASAPRSAAAWPTRARRSPPATARTSEQAEEFLDELLEQTASRARSTRATSARPTTAAAWSTRCIDAHGRLDILVNNAGITIDKPVLKMTDEDWDKVLARQPVGRVLHVQAGARAHDRARQRPDREHLARSSASTGNIGQANYAASKSGLFGLTMTLAREAAQALAKHEKLHDNGLD